MLKLSGVIITYNEERNIERCLESLVGVVDEIVVVDSFSNDNTKAICKKYKVQFIEQEFLGYVEQKNFALQHASFNHIVSLDGDEALSDTLQQSIKAVKTNWTKDGYYCNRYNNFCGQWIKYSDWYPNRKLRVFDKRNAKWKGINPHDNVVLNDSKQTAGFLEGDIFIGPTVHIKRWIRKQIIFPQLLQRLTTRIIKQHLFGNYSGTLYGPFLKLTF